VVDFSESGCIEGGKMLVFGEKKWIWRDGMRMKVALLTNLDSSTDLVSHRLSTSVGHDYELFKCV
jgi:hypothetical protein